MIVVKAVKEAQFAISPSVDIEAIPVSVFHRHCCSYARPTSVVPLLQICQGKPTARCCRSAAGSFYHRRKRFLQTLGLGQAHPAMGCPIRPGPKTPANAHQALKASLS